MKWEIEGELYLKENGYDQYDVIEPYIITKDMDRCKIIYKNVGQRYIDGAWQTDELKKQIKEGLLLSEWIEYEIGLNEGRVEYHYEHQNYKDEKTHTDKRFCSLSEESFQPQTKKVRITIEEID